MLDAGIILMVTAIGLTQEELEIINMDRYSVRFHEGEVILKQGTKADYLISVVEGFAKTCIEGHNERNLILDYVKPWRLVGGPAAHIGGKHRYSVIAVQETLIKTCKEIRAHIQIPVIRKILNQVFSERNIVDH